MKPSKLYLHLSKSQIEIVDDKLSFLNEAKGIFVALDLDRLKNQTSLYKHVCVLNCVVVIVLRLVMTSVLGHICCVVVRTDIIGDDRKR